MYRNAGEKHVSQAEPVGVGETLFYRHQMTPDGGWYRMAQTREWACTIAASMLVVVAVGLPLETIAADRLSRLTGGTPREGGRRAAYLQGDLETKKLLTRSGRAVRPIARLHPGAGGGRETRLRIPAARVS